MTADLASARSDAAIGLELLVITAVVLGGVNIFGGGAVPWSAFWSRSSYLLSSRTLWVSAGVTPEEQQIVTGGVLVMTLIVFSTSGIIRKVGMARSRPPDH